MKEAIRLAIEKGGYSLKFAEQRYQIDVADRSHPGSIALTSMFLDPAFWRALGKALGWSMEFQDINTMTNASGEFKSAIFPEWLYQWHRFIDHIADEGEPDDFFKELLAERSDK